MPGPGYYYAGDEEIREVLEVLQTGHLSRYGSDDDPKFLHKVYDLEQAVRSRLGAGYCVAVNSGTSALMAALVAAGIQPGDEVLVPGYTFIASISAILAVGGAPVLTEIDESLTMDPLDAEARITPRTRFIMPVHMLGNPCDLERILSLAKRHNLVVIEDCCQALGGGYRGKKLGSYGALGAFSLNSYKVIYAGDGGLLVTSERELYERAFGFHDQGHLPLRKGVEIGHRSLIGINMRMNELTGAFALGQLRKLDRILAVLHEKKQVFKQAIQAGDIRNMAFRRINDPDECATLVTVLFEDEAAAAKVAQALHSKAVSHSGWHVYNNMEQLLAYTDPSGNHPYRKHMLPQTDDILGRSLNLSVGVVDPGLGADFGINILSSEDEITGKPKSSSAG